MQQNIITDKIWFLSALRGVASFLVVIEHLVFLFWVGNGTIIATFPYIRPITNNSVPFYYNLVDFLSKVHFGFGAFGVALFFLISGFVISLSLEKIRGIKFIISRIFRIFPTYIIGFSITFLAIFVYVSLRKIAFPYSLGNYLAEILLIRDWFWIPSIDGISWTLETEIKFYIIIFIIAAIGKLNSSKVIVATSLGLSLTTVMLSNQYASLLNTNIRIYYLVYIITYSCISLSFMLIGVCFYNFYKKYWSLKEFIVSIQIMYVSFMVANFNGPDAQSLFMVLFVSYTAALFVFTNFYLLKDSIKFNPVLNFLADISYPLYVVHGVNGYMIQSILDKFNVNQYVSILITVSFSIGLAYILHVLVEDPTNQLGKKIIKSTFFTRPLPIFRLRKAAKPDD